MRSVSPFLIGLAFSGVGSKCGSAGCSFVPTIGYSPMQSSPSSPNRLTMNCWTSYWVSVRDARSSLPTRANASSLMRCTLSPASRCDR